VLAFKPHSKSIDAAVFSPDGRYLATSSGDETVTVTDLSGCSAEQKLSCSGLWCPLAFSPDGKLLARGGRGVEVWSLHGPTLEFAAGNFTESLAFSPDGRTLASQGADRPVSRWAVPSWTALPGGWGGTRGQSDGERFATGCLAYAPDGSVLATSFGVRGNRGYDSIIFLWDADSGKLRGQLYWEIGISQHRLATRFRGPTAIAFSPDGKLLAGAYGPTANVFDVATEEKIATVKPGKKYFQGLAFSPDGRLVTVSNDRTVRVWEARTLKEVRAYEWKIGKLGAVAVAPDGQRMAAGGHTGRVVIWDVDD
jgi:WD40 repeat protein